MQNALARKGAARGCSNYMQLTKHREKTRRAADYIGMGYKQWGYARDQDVNKYTIKKEAWEYTRGIDAG